MAAQDLETMTTILSQLNAALERWYDGDPWGYADLYAEDFTYFDPYTNDRLTSRAEMRSHYETIEGTVKLPRFKIITPVASRLDELVVLTYFLKQYNDEGPWGPTWKTTEIYRDDGDGTWKIVHGHWSACTEES